MESENLIVSTGKSLPEEAIVEVLARLPIQCLLKCKCVCKDWNALISEHYFIEKHMRQMRIACKARRLDSVFEIRSEFGTRRNESDDRTRHRTTNAANAEATVRKSFKRINSINGVILERSYATRLYRIRNPATRQLLYLPNPTHASFALTVGCDASGVYKLVSFYCISSSTSSGGCEILRLGGDELSWRILEAPCLHDFCKEERAKLVGAISGCWHLIRRGKSNMADVVTFKLQNESIRRTFLPQDFFLDWNNVYAFPWIENGKRNLSIAEMVKVNLKVVVVMEDHKSEFVQRKVDVYLKFLKDRAEFEGELQPYHFAEGMLKFRFVGHQVLYYNIEEKRFKVRKIVKGVAKDMQSIVSFKGMMPQ